MKKTTCFFLTATMVGVLFASACSPAPTQTVVVQATNLPIQTLPNPPTVPVESTAHTYAAACPVEPACVPQDIKSTEPTDTYCVDKIPYQNFNVEPGTKLEPVEPSSDLKCFDSFTVDSKGNNVWTCTGRQLWTYELKITNPACQTHSLLPNSDKCQANSGYDAEQNCCAPISTTPSGGDLTINVNMGACP